MLNFENVLKTIRSAKEYHTHEKQKGGVTDEYRIKHITMEEEYSMAEKVLLDLQSNDAEQPNASKPAVSGALLSFEQCLREEFLVNTQNYPKEYHQLFKQKYERAEKRFREQSGNDR